MASCTKNNRNTKKMQVSNAASGRRSLFAKLEIYYDNNLNTYGVLRVLVAETK